MKRNDTLLLGINISSGGFVIFKDFFNSLTIEQWIAIFIQILTFVIYLIKTIKEMKRKKNGACEKVDRSY